MKRMSVAAALWLAVGLFAAEGDNPLENAARKDVPDAILDKKFTPQNIQRTEVKRVLRPPAPGDVPTTVEFIKHEGIEKITVEQVRRALKQDPLETKGPKEDEEARLKIKEALERKLTFEFADTPLDEAIAFLKTLTKIEIAYDASVLAGERNKTPVNLKAADVALEAALSAICRQAELKWELRGTSIVIYAPVRERAERPERPERNDRMDERNPMPKLHAKLPDGTEIEADMPLLMMPGVGQMIADRVLDPAKDGILVYNLVRDFEPGFSVERLKEAVVKVAPHVSIEILWIGNGLVVATSESAGELRKAQTIIRALKPQMGPLGDRRPPPDEGRRRPPEGQPPQPKKDRREDPPGQF